MPPKAPAASPEAPPPGADAPNPAVMTTGDAASAQDQARTGIATGNTDVPVQVPGPGAGALQVAEASQGFETRPLDQESRDPRERAPITFEGLGTRNRAGSILAGASGVVDANLVPGNRLVMAATNILRDGRQYRPGDRLPVDFAAYTELVQIGAVVATPWSDLERED